jgi:hypothetical protein
MRSPAALQASSSTNGAMALLPHQPDRADSRSIVVLSGIALIAFARLRTGR